VQASSPSVSKFSKGQLYMYFCSKFSRELNFENFWQGVALVLLYRSQMYLRKLPNTN